MIICVVLERSIIADLFICYINSLCSLHKEPYHFKLYLILLAAHKLLHNEWFEKILMVFTASSFKIWISFVE